MNTDVMFSSATDEWETPQDFFDKLDSEFHFTLDVCATDENAKCPNYFTRAQDGLSRGWGGQYVLDESALWTEDRGLGKESLRRVFEWNDCRLLTSRPHRYEVVA